MRRSFSGSVWCPFTFRAVSGGVRRRGETVHSSPTCLSTDDQRRGTTARNDRGTHLSDGSDEGLGRMREFASASARAATLPRAAKVLYTAFCAFVGLGIASCAGLYDGIVAFATRATPGELYARLIAHYQTGIATRALLEVTHAHLFVSLGISIGHSQTRTFV